MEICTLIGIRLETRILRSMETWSLKGNTSLGFSLLVFVALQEQTHLLCRYAVIDQQVSMSATCQAQSLVK